MTADDVWLGVVESDTDGGPMSTIPDDLAAVVVHGPATNPLTRLLWDLGLRPLPGTTGATVWCRGRHRSSGGCS